MSPRDEPGTWLQWTAGDGHAARVPFAQLRWSADVLAGDGPTWSRVVPMVLQRYDHDTSWIFHATRLETLHDLPCEPAGRWSVYHWQGEWHVDFHQQVACPGASLPLLVALTAAEGCGPTAIR